MKGWEWQERLFLKGAESRDFRPPFFSLIETIWAPDFNRPKWFLLNMRFCEDIRIFPEYLSENELLSQTILA